jgi:hypothetical protein
MAAKKKRIEGFAVGIGQGTLHRRTGGSDRFDDKPEQHDAGV